MDFPAAHSMDSTWFAVDADGHVAIFHTGEEGALPRGARRGYGDQALGVIYARECARAFAASALDDERALDDEALHDALVLVLDGAHPDARALLDDPTIARVCDDPPTVWIDAWPDAGSPAVRALRGSPALRASFHVPDPGSAVTAATLGIYDYANEAWETPGLYERTGDGPARPRVVSSMEGLTVHALPASRFARDAQVAVDAQLACQYYGARDEDADDPTAPPEG